MTLDYAKKSLTSSRRSSHKLVISIILVFSITTLMIFSFFIHHQTISQSHPHFFSSKKIKLYSTVIDQASNSSLVPNKLEQPQFEFYTLLPKMEVTELLPMSPTLFDTRTVIPLTNFILQIASFKNITDAERLKSRLSLNFPCYIQIYRTKNGIVWNRVMVGPYHTHQAAERTQSKLKAHSIHSLLLKAVP
ncbi:SPOR domain-containing protein [Coxiella-like endosymbiont]|uniref:SPOR domain-containing protein n=1 Tax=Coxiella-like endosymbiont TaxID=1592897 RepID=UPI0011AF987C|nr:SPOR domain-containing protein [Coxiella-like endosymbiont]